MQVVFRLCQMWFELSESDTVNVQVQKIFRDVPSYKFVPLVYQIASRISSAPTKFQQVGWARYMLFTFDRLARN